MISGFLFHTVPPSERLDKTDAVFVDVLHSAGLWIGSDEVVGEQCDQLRQNFAIWATVLPLGKTNLKYIYYLAKFLGNFW